MRKIIVSLAALLGGVCVSSATVTPYAWYHAGENGITFDSAPGDASNAHAINKQYGHGSVVYIYLAPIGAGGPLGPSGYISTESTLFGDGHTDANGEWIGGSNATGGDGVPTTNMWDFNYTNFVMECWILPMGNGCLNGPPFGGQTHSQFLCTGTGEYGGRNGGARFVIDDDALGNPNSVQITAQAIGPDAANNFNIGNSVTLDTNRWMHLAVVVDSTSGNAVTTFYVNGVPHGASTTNNLDPAGHFLTPAVYPTTPYFGSGQDTPNPYWGYLDEMRFSYFDPGQFSVGDLLTRTSSGPSITGQPQSTTVWAGGAAPFKVTTVYDTSTTYQWQRGGINISGATRNPYVADPVAVSDSGAQFDCKVTASSISVTSSNATLTVIANNPANVAAYRSLVTGNPNLVGYFPVDNDSGSTLTDLVDHTYNGTLELNAYFDGRTNTSFGQRAVAFNGDGDVQIPNNPAFEFSSGEGTIEAVIYEDPAAAFVATDHTILAEANNGDTTTAYFYLRASANGSFLKYGNSGVTPLSWVAPANLLGQFAHVAVVIHQVTNVTAYINGINLGTKTQDPSAGFVGEAFWIGSMGTSSADNWWYGSVDEVAYYSAALSQTTLQQHYSAFIFGTNTSAPSIVSQPASRTVLAGASPTITVKASGTLPLTYLWKANNVAIPGATTASLQVTNIAATTTYVLNVQNAYGQTNSDPIVVTTTAPPAGYLSKIMPDGPIALWRLAETSGTVAVDSAGFNDGTYSGGVTLGGPSFPTEAAPAAKFNGSSGLAVVPRLGGPAVQALNPQGSFSIEFWAELDAYGFYVPISSMNRPSRDSGYEFYLFGNFPGFEWHVGPGGYNAFVGSSDVPATGTWYHIAAVFDLSGGGNGTLRMYINGVENDAAPGGGADLGSPFVANTILPLYIGARSDNGHFWPGSLADVALYNYVLTTNQIANHYSAINSAAAMTQQPAGVTNQEGVAAVITLTAAASGTPNTYQWYRGNTPLTDVNNADGTAHYPTVNGGFNTILQGVNGSSLVISEATTADSGTYHLVVSNPLGGATSSNATVLITADTNPPVVTSVQALGTPNIFGGPTPFLVKVTFDKRVDPTTAGVSGNYPINGSVTVNTATLRGDLQAPALGTDWKTVFLQTSGLTPGQQYSLTVSGVKDQAQSPNTIAPKAISFMAPRLTQGVLQWDFYYEITPQAVSSLTSDQNYPYAPATNGFMTAFDTDQVTGTDLNNNPAFGSLGDNYGDVLSGWITPTVTGDYYFFLASDDASELDLSTDNTVANAQPIATETGCCHGFQEPELGTATTSSLQHLVAGTPYFIRTLHTEGGGGDYVKVAWRLSTDSTAATNLPPIAAQFLSAFVLATPKFNAPVFSSGQLTLSWTGQGTLMQSTNVALPFSQWTPVPGNPNPYTVTPATGAPREFYRLQQ